MKMTLPQSFRENCNFWHLEYNKSGFVILYKYKAQYKITVLKHIEQVYKLPIKVYSSAARVNDLKWGQ